MERTLERVARAFKPYQAKIHKKRNILEKDKGWKTGHDPKRIRCGCCLSALTGLARFSPEPIFRDGF